MSLEGGTAGRGSNEPKGTRAGTPRFIPGTAKSSCVWSVGEAEARGSRGQGWAGNPGPDDIDTKVKCLRTHSLKYPKT